MTEGVDFSLMVDNSLRGIPPDEWAGGTHGLQCLFCSDKILNSPAQLMTAEVVESIPIILNFHPANIPNWSQRLLQTSLCSNCHQITLEGTKLHLLLVDIQRQLTHISATITNKIRKGYFGDSTSHHAHSDSACCEDQVLVSSLRHDLSRCLQLEPFQDSLEQQSYKHDLSDDDVNQRESDDWHPTLVAVDEHLEEEFPCNKGEENEVLGNYDGDPEFAPETKRRKITKFTQNEAALLWKLYQEKSKGQSLMRKRTKNSEVVRTTWDEIAMEVSSVANIQRTGEQCRNRINNYKRMPYEDVLSEDAFENPTKLEVESHEILLSTSDPNLLQDNDHNTVVHTSNGCFTLKTFQLKLQRCDEDEESFIRIPRTTIVQQQRRTNLKQRLDRHRQLATVGEKLDRRIVYCPIKKKVLPEPQNVRRTRHPPPLQHSCPVKECNQEFVGVVSLERHIRDKHGWEFHHFCELCGKGFCTPIGLQTHKTRNHNESLRKFSCDICPAKFVELEILSQHKVRVHAAETAFLCEVCSVGFKYKLLLEDHQGKMHGDLDAEKFKPERQTCPTCGYICATRGYLQLHMSQHVSVSSVPLRKYVCIVANCDKRFHAPSKLKNHMAYVHSEERNFQCHLCPNSYKDVHTLNYHLRRHGGLTAFKCPHCPKSLANPTSLKSHIKVIHESNPTIKCEDCGEGFPIRKYYLRHRLICAQGFSGTSKKSTPKHVRSSSTAGRIHLT